jgi:hypothetical protein
VLGDQVSLASESVVSSNRIRHLRVQKEAWTCPETGNIYEGEWVGDQKDGFGTMIWSVNGTTYTGQWRNNVPHGNGKFTKSNGQVFETHEGSWHKGRAHGFGKFIQQSFQGVVLFSYEGKWQFGKKHGKGTEIWQDGSKYIGTFANDLKNGEGYLQMADGSYYQGQFEDGMLSGYGLYIWKNKK